MTVEYNVVKLGVRDALPQIKQKLVGYMSRHNGIYIGVTTNPRRRARDHERMGRSRMVVLYEAWRAPIAADIEQELIAWAAATNFRLERENRGRGGESIPGDAETWYVYVALS